ncbi:unnamed protein product [Closterium sp. NIES-53]
MASLRVLAFEHEGRPIQFDTWLDNLQLYLLSDSRDSVLFFDHTSGAAPTPPAIADSAIRSQWLTRDAGDCLAILNYLPSAECTHFGEHRTAHALYDAVVAHYSSSATAALGRLLLPYLFPELSAFALATVEDLGPLSLPSSAEDYTSGSGSDSWRSTRSSSVLCSSCEAKIYTGAMAAQELRWLTYLLTDLGERPRSPPVLYVDNKAMIALCE